MKSIKHLLSLIMVATIVVVACAACGRNSLIAGTYIHEADDTFGEFVIVHDGDDVTVTINGTDYPAEMEQENDILVDGKYTILESYNNDDGEPDIENCTQDSIIVLDAKDWIEGDYEVNSDGNLDLVLMRQ